MISFKHFISESFLIVEGKNTHLEHAEDLILNSGYSGAKEAIASLEGVAGMLAGHSDQGHMLTTKWDGNPALFCGSNPENGKFFVGTKGIFSKSNPRICYSHEDIDNFYGGVEGLANVLHSALKYLPELGIKGFVLQGDVLFSSPDDIQEKSFEGEDYVTFHPNTILYAVPTKSELGKRIRQAKFGIIFHTAYKGDSIHNLHGTFKISLDSLNKSKNVWYDDASYMDTSGSVTMTEKETNYVHDQLQNAKTVLAQITQEDFQKLFSNKTYIQLLKQHQNQLIRGGEHIEDIEQWLGKLPGFVEQKVGKEKTKPEAQQRKIQRLHAHTQDLMGVLKKVLQFQKLIVTIKHTLIGKLENAKKVGTFHVSDKGLTVAKQEGFVAVDHIGNAVKLVDRLEFSRQNWARRSENEEIADVANTGPTMKQGSYMGGETGLAGKDEAQSSYLGRSTGQFTDSTRTL